jgi:TatD DNase family protein
MKYIDIHSHLNLSPLKERQEEIINKLYLENTKTITVGVDLETSREAVKIALENEILFATVGKHPTDSSHESFDYEEYKKLAQNEKVLAIGECGLDYFRLTGNEEEVKKEKERQKYIFEEQIKLSVELNKPLMIHARPKKNTMDAYEDILNILNEYISNEIFLRGNFHFFVGNLDILKKVLEIGFTVSFDGPITFTSEYDDIIKYVPLDMFHIETDSPFATGNPHRGDINFPYYVKFILKRISEIKEIDEEKLSIQLEKNFEKHFLNNKI